MNIPEVCEYIRERVGDQACIVDAVMTTTLTTKKPPGPQQLHYDISLPEDPGVGKIGTLVKLVFSIEGRPLLTEFGQSRTPMQARAALFDAVRCLFKVLAICPVALALDC